MWRKLVHGYLPHRLWVAFFPLVATDRTAHAPWRTMRVSLDLFTVSCIITCHRVARRTEGVPPCCWAEYPAFCPCQPLLQPHQWIRICASTPLCLLITTIGRSGECIHGVVPMEVYFYYLYSGCGEMVVCVHVLWTPWKRFAVWRTTTCHGVPCMLRHWLVI